MATRDDDDGDGKDVGLRLLLVAAVILAARALHLQTNRHRMTRKEARGENPRTLRRLRMRSSIVCCQPVDNS